MSFKTFFITVFMCFFLFCFGFNSAMAQNFNIDFGTACGTPANTYGAAGLAGVWNGISSLGASPLTDIAGVATPATVTVTATAYGNSCSDCSPPVNALVGDYFYSSFGGWSVVFSNLTDGDYTVFIYGPSEPTIATGSFMSVNGVSVPGISGDNCNLLEGTSYVAVPATVTGGVLTISGAGSALAHGLAGIQLQTTSAVGIPTMTQWGMIIFLVLAGFGAVYYIRRQKTAKS